MKKFPSLSMTVLRILIVDDHPLVRAGLMAVIGNVPDMQVVAEGRDGAEAISLFSALRPDVLLIDLRMPVNSGVAAIEAIRASAPDARIIALTTYDGDADIHRALKAGACGYLLKDSIGREVIEALRSAAGGRRVIPAAVAARLAEFTPRVDLTDRELEVLGFVGKGLRNKAISRAIGRTEATVKVHLKHIMEKLGAADRTQAVTQALRRGMIHLED